MDIRDFGLFQGEKLEDLGCGIIVIGGANRSGKTSFMQILRNIPFGFTKGSNLPPPKFQYDVRCNLLSEDGEQVNVLLKGFSNPEIVNNNTCDNKDNKGLYNLDKLSYRELFTISLDELNKSTDREDSNLQSMLLGAGFKHIVKIPGLAKELRGKANAIGGTRGNPSTKMFKPFVENIRRGVEGRKQSILLLDSFVQKKNSLSRLEDNIILKEKQLEISNNNLIKLEILKHNYELNERRKELEVELKTYHFNHSDVLEYNIEKARALKNQYIKELKQYNNDNNEFIREAPEDKLIKELLLGNKVKIISFYNEISGIKEMIKNLLFYKNECYEKTEVLINKMKKANDNWVSFKDVSEINCDEVQQAILKDNIEESKKMQSEKTAHDKTIEDCRIQKEILENQILSSNSSTFMKRYIYFTIFFAIIGLVLFFIDKLLGCSIIVIGAVGTAFYLFINYSSNQLIVKRNEEIKEQIDCMRINFSTSSEEIKVIEENLGQLFNIMDEYRDILKLDGRVSEDGIKEYFKTAAYLKDEVYELQLLKKKLNNQFNELYEYLNIISHLLNKFLGFNTSDLEGVNLNNISNSCNGILLKVEVLYKQLMLGEKVDLSFSKLKMLEVEILEFLHDSYSENIVLDIEKYINMGEKYIKYTNEKVKLKNIQDRLLQGVKSKRVKKILYDEKIDFDRSGNVDFQSDKVDFQSDYKAPKIKDENTKLLEILENLYERYTSIKDLDYDYEALAATNKEIIAQVDILKNEKQTLKDKLTALNSDEMLVMHDKGIRQARNYLRPLAEKYAVYNTAALLLEKIRERFLLNTKDNLLKGASDILSKITSGEYKDIIPGDDLMQGDFKTKLRDESIKESSKELSRGTREQLFLAVRISRIKEIKPSLPVILDDSFVNFDIAHSRNTVKALVQLSKTHQIFVLTCHATLVDLVINQSSTAQYFKLDKGRFTKTLGVDLKEYLNGL